MRRGTIKVTDCTVNTSPGDLREEIEWNAKIALLVFRSKRVDPCSSIFLIQLKYALSRRGDEKEARCGQRAFLDDHTNSSQRAGAQPPSCDQNISTFSISYYFQQCTPHIVRYIAPKATEIPRRGTFFSKVDRPTVGPSRQEKGRGAPE